jgi:hypothetical protein
MKTSVITKSEFLNSIFFIASLFVFSVLLSGCATTKNSPAVNSPKGQVESTKDVTEALEAVVGAVSGQDVNTSDLKGLIQDIRQDEETRSAVESISGALAQPAGRVHYCPVDGKRFSPKITTCPDHKVPLQWVDEDQGSVVNPVKP